VCLDDLYVTVSRELKALKPSFAQGVPVDDSSGRLTMKSIAIIFMGLIGACTGW